MRKPISTRVHGIMDYMTAGFLFALPRAMGSHRDAHGSAIRGRKESEL